MKKKPHNENDVVAVMNKIQEQLAVLDRKLDAFMTKSLTELAQARAAAKPVIQAMHVPVPTSARPSEHRPSRPMYAVVCFDCGKDTEIPFKPSGDRPVYCKECFAKRRAGSTTKTGEAKPQMASSYEPMPSVNVSLKPAPTVSNAASSASKKKSAPVKKAATKKKVVAKKKAKKK